MHGRLRVGGELAHRRRAAEALGWALQLGDDLLVAVALPETGLKRLQGIGIDAIERATLRRGGQIEEQDGPLASRPRTAVTLAPEEHVIV